MAENKKEGAQKYFFTRGQLIVLAAGFTLATAVIFFLGILIGQKIEERKLLKNSERIVKMPFQSPPSGSAEKSASKEEMTFYDTLTKNAPAAKAAAKKPANETRPEVKSAEAKPKEKKSSEETAGAQKKPLEAVDGKPWTIQVNAFQQESDARSLAKKLTERGYDAYVTSNKNQTWYRVRVGRFASKDETQELLEKLKTKERFTSAMSVSR
jgi:cell division septation protein DedD